MMEEKKSNKKAIIILCVIAAIVLLVIGIIVGVSIAKGSTTRGTSSLACSVTNSDYADSAQIKFHLDHNQQIAVIDGYFSMNPSNRYYALFSNSLFTKGLSILPGIKFKVKRNGNYINGEFSFNYSKTINSVSKIAGLVSKFVGYDEEAIKSLLYMSLPDFEYLLEDRGFYCQYGY